MILASLAANPPSASRVISPYMAVFFVAFAVAIVMTPVMRWLAIRNGIVDWPNLKHKSHIEPVAYLGGVAIFLAWIAAISLCYFVYFGGPHTPQAAVHIRFPFSIIVGAAVITLTGLIDDVYGISPRVKIGGQFFAAAMLAMNRVGINLVDQMFKIIKVPAPDWLIYTLGAVVIAVFVIGGCNSVNLLDGLDGLASGVVAIAVMGFLAIAAFVALGSIEAAAQGKAVDPTYDAVRIVMCLAILGAVLGFLPYNFNPANIFMGDAGALLLGYLSVATILLFAEAGGQGPRLVTAALIVFALPITDTALAIFRRTMRRQSIFKPDSQHLHHQLLSAARRSLRLGPNASVKFAVLVMYVLAAIFAVLGGALVSERWRYMAAFFVVIFGFVIVSAYKAGHRQVLLEKIRKSAHAQAPADTDAGADAPLPDQGQASAEPKSASSHDASARHTA